MARSYLVTLDEIGRWLRSSDESVRVLTNVACLVGNRVLCDACSIYLLTPDGSELVLSGTVGLRQDCVGQLNMGLDEGLTGLTAESGQQVVVCAEARQHPRFRYFPEAGEEPFESFLGTPIIHADEVQGVLVVQTIEPRRYSEEDMRLLSITGSGLGPLAARCRLQPEPVS